MPRAKSKPKSAPKPTRLSALAGPVRAIVRRSIDLTAKYDAAQTTDENRRHWAAADGLSADAAANPVVRAALRNRCRYEYANNSYCKGIIDTLANDTVGGTGPRLQMLTDLTELDEAVERDFADWGEEVGLAEVLRCMRAGRGHSGEAFALMGTNPGLSCDVKLSVWLVEPEQVTSPYLIEPSDQMVDGIEYDQWGNPATYYVLKFHPGGLNFAGIFGAEQFKSWPAKYVLHYYRPDRPDQRRGVPDVTPAAQLFAELRRYCAAVIAAAETAADYSAVIYSDAAPDADQAENTTPETMDTVELTRRMATVMPQGWKLGQLQAEQPTTTYGDFVGEKLKEIARCLQVPYTIAALDSSKANMSASYLDGQRYANSVYVDRARLESLLNRLLDVWLEEWIKVHRTVVPERLPHQWFWPSMGHHADPNKVAKAQAAKLEVGTTTIPREYAKDGLDWEKEQASAAKSVGVTVDEYRKMLREKMFAPRTSDSTTPDPTTPEDEE